MDQTMLMAFGLTFLPTQCEAAGGLSASKSLPTTQSARIPGGANA
jgi:hypothetical protein